MRRLLRRKAQLVRSQILVTTGAGHGSTNSNVRRIETAHTSFGKAITVTHSATDGTSFTINEDGIYSMSYADIGTGGIAFGFSKNSAQLTTGVETITDANLLMLTFSPANQVGCVSWSGPLKAGDVVRPHTDGTPNNTSTRVRFNISKMGP